MKRLMVLFAMVFPYSTSEPFLENEYPFYKDHYDKTIIVTGCKRGEKPTRQIEDSTIEVIPDYTLSKDVYSVIETLPWLLTDKIFYKEIFSLFQKKIFSVKRFYALLVTALCSNHRALQTYRWIKKHPEYQVDVIYAYWLNIPAYAAVRLNKKIGKKAYTVSRAHGFDLYIERNPNQHLPFQEQIYHEIDEIAFISDNGEKYLEEKYGKKEKTSVFRLGAVDCNLRNPAEKRDVFRVVSCARVIPLKRLPRIVDALKTITDKEIIWTHFGDGEDFEMLKSYAEKELPQNIRTDFRGFIPNTQIYDIYAKKPFHVFINVSETEGVPVSIMEAMSFGIPAIATDVGGSSEVVEDKKNGYLLSADFSDEDLIRYIRHMINMTDDEYEALRFESRKKFERDYNAIPNYRRFLKHISDRKKES